MVVGIAEDVVGGVVVSGGSGTLLAVGEVELIIEAVVVSVRDDS